MAVSGFSAAVQEVEVTRELRGNGDFRLEMGKFKHVQWLYICSLYIYICIYII